MSNEMEMAASRGRVKRIALGITGASGAIYASRLLTHLKGLGVEVHCAISETARITWKWELGREFQDSIADWDHVQWYEERDFMSPIASGSFRHDGMAIVPCSTRTLGCIAAGLSGNLIQRGAEVCLKERRKLILVVRESPYTLGHLENMTRLTQSGAVVIPASPGFYHRPRSIEDLVDFILSRTLDHLGIENSLIQRWGESAEEAEAHV